MPFDGFSRSYQQLSLIYRLARARDRLAADGGWCQYAYYRGRGDSSCAAGALLVDGGGPACGAAALALVGVMPRPWRVFAAFLGWVFRDTDLETPARTATLVVMLYNDVPWRRQKEVVHLFDLALQSAIMGEDR